MRKLLALASAGGMLAVGVALSGTAHAGPPPDDAIVNFGYVAKDGPGPTTGATPAIEDAIYCGLGQAVPRCREPFEAPSDLPGRAEVLVPGGASVAFKVDGPHQVLLYRLHEDESYGQAYDKLNALAETKRGPTLRARMAGLDTYGSAGTPVDALTQDDIDFGFTYLTPRKATPPYAGTVTVRFDEPDDAGRYVMLCNVRGHYRPTDPQGTPTEAFSMRGELHVTSPARP